MRLFLFGPEKLFYHLKKNTLLVLPFLNYSFFVPLFCESRKKIQISFGTKTFQLSCVQFFVGLKRLPHIS